MCCVSLTAKWLFTFLLEYVLQIVCFLLLFDLKKMLKQRPLELVFKVKTLHLLFQENFWKKCWISTSTYTRVIFNTGVCTCIYCKYYILNNNTFATSGTSVCSYGSHLRLKTLRLVLCIESTRVNVISDAPNPKSVSTAAALIKLNLSSKISFISTGYWIIEYLTYAPMSMIKSD